MTTESQRGGVGDMRNAIAKARDEWLDSEEGSRCRNGPIDGLYLRNRLECAFIAGYNAASPVKVEACEAVSDDLRNAFFDEFGSIATQKIVTIIERLRTAATIAHGTYPHPSLFTGAADALEAALSSRRAKGENHG